jgi:hypothetical protein
MAHSPICEEGIERYLFIGMPHIAIDNQGKIGHLTRMGREHDSHAFI